MGVCLGIHRIRDAFWLDPNQLSQITPFLHAHMTINALLCPLTTLNSEGQMQITMLVPFYKILWILRSPNDVVLVPWIVSIGLASSFSSTYTILLDLTDLLVRPKRGKDGYDTYYYQANPSLSLKALRSNVSYICLLKWSTSDCAILRMNGFSLGRLMILFNLLDRKSVV